MTGGCRWQQWGSPRPVKSPSSVGAQAPFAHRLQLRHQPTNPRKPVVLNLRNRMFYAAILNFLHVLVPALAVRLVPHALDGGVNAGLAERVEVADAQGLGVDAMLKTGLRRARRQDDSLRRGVQARSLDGADRSKELLHILGTTGLGSLRHDRCRQTAEQGSRRPEPCSTNVCCCDFFQRTFAAAFQQTPHFTRHSNKNGDMNPTRGAGGHEALRHVNLEPVAPHVLQTGRSVLGTGPRPLSERARSNADNANNGDINPTRRY